MVNSSPSSLFGIHVPHFLGFAFSTTYTENRIRLKPPCLFWGHCFVPNLFSVLRFRSYPIAKRIKRKQHSINQLASHFMDATRQTDTWKREANMTMV